MYVDDLFYMYAEDASFGSTSSINPRLLISNVDAFEKAGLDLPPMTYDTAWTWSEFVDVAQKLTLDAFGHNAKDPAFDPNMIVQYGCYFDCSDVIIQSVFLDSNGADLLNEDGTACTLNTPEAIEVYQALYDLIYKYHVTPVPVEMSTVASDIPTALKGGQAAMAIAGQYVLLDIAKMHINFELGVVPMFKEPRNVKQAGTRVIFSNTENKEEAWKLFKFLASPEGALNLYYDGLWMPVLKEWYEDEELFAKWGKDNPAHPDSYRTVAVDSLFLGVATPNLDIRVSNFAEIQTLLRSMLDPVWLNSAPSVEEQLNLVVEALDPLVQGYNPGCYHNSHYHTYKK